MNREEIVQGVRECLANVLEIEVGPIREEDRILPDLGADSLDLLDLSFHLQQRFGITISPRDIEKHVQEKLGDTPFEIDGAYTLEGIAEIRASMPEIPEEELPEGLTRRALTRSFRVATMANLVERSLAGKDG